MATAQDTTVGPGIFITFEGGDGAGKTTHITFLAECLRKMGHEVLCLHASLAALPLVSAASLFSIREFRHADQAELLIYEAAHGPNRKRDYHSRACARGGCSARQVL